MSTASLEAQRERQRRIVDCLGRGTAMKSAGGVERIETHLSWLFLTDECAIKLKKALHYRYLDYSTVEARRRQCEAEVRLNRRLAPEVYLGMGAVTEDEHGELALDAHGVPVEYVVFMRRLAEHGNFDSLLRRGMLTTETVATLARVLARFYQHLFGSARDPDRYVRGLHHAIAADATALSAPSYGLDHRLVRRIAATLHGLARASERYRSAPAAAASWKATGIYAPSTSISRPCPWLSTA